MEVWVHGYVRVNHTMIMLPLFCVNISTLRNKGAVEVEICIMCTYTRIILAEDAAFVAGLYLYFLVCRMKGVNHKSVAL